MNISLNIDTISATPGSLNWLLSQKISARFGVSLDGSTQFRGAELTVGKQGVATFIVAADGYYSDSYGHVWLPGHGVQDNPLQLDEYDAQNFLMEVALTPAAKALLERIAADLRMAFRTWIESDRASDEIAINFFRAQ